MKLRSVALTMMLLTPSLASAEPITLGVWSAMPAADGNSQPFWDGLSWDCPTCGVGYFLSAYGPLEYLNDGTGDYTPFRFEGAISPPVLILNNTAWLGGTFGQSANGAFTYDSGTGRLSNSLDNGEQYALFRRVGPMLTTYFLGIEDILLSETSNDLDYNDYVVTFTQPTPVPEPSTMVLVGSALAGYAAKRARSKRKNAA
jgi:hypothetical protein